MHFMLSTKRRKKVYSLTREQFKALLEIRNRIMKAKAYEEKTELVRQFDDLLDEIEMEKKRG